MEVCDDAMFLISISHQANKRYKHAGKYIKVIGNTIPCDELVSVVFLGFYLEASLTYIIEKMGKAGEIVNFYYPNRKTRVLNIGLRKKIAWFYNRYVAKEEMNKNALLDENNKIDETLEREFPGFKRIYAFRNNIAHGELDEAIKRIILEFREPKAVDELRTQAKDIVDLLIDIANKSSCSHISKIVSYENALKNYGY